MYPQKQSSKNSGLLSSGRNYAAEIYSKNLPSLNISCSNYDLAEIPRRKSTARISDCLTALREMLSSSGDSAAEIHSKIFPCLWSFADSEGHSKSKERRIPCGQSVGIPAGMEASQAADVSWRRSSPAAFFPLHESRRKQCQFRSASTLEYTSTTQQRHTR